MVTAAISASETFSSPARAWAVWATKAGSLRWPRCGTGASQGASVSDQDSIQRHAHGHVAQRLRLGVGEIAGKGDQKSHVERAPRLLPAGAETVHNAAQPGFPPMLVKNEKEIVPGVGGFIGAAAVDEDGPAARGGNFELADQALSLHFAGRALVVIVEADFTAGNDFGLGKKRVQLGECGLVGFGSAVRVDARARIKARQARPAVELATEIERLVHLRRALADADGKHCAYTRFSARRSMASRSSA